MPKKHNLFVCDCRLKCNKSNIQQKRTKQLWQLPVGMGWFYFQPIIWHRVSPSPDILKCQPLAWLASVWIWHDPIKFWQIKSHVLFCSNYLFYLRKYVLLWALGESQISSCLREAGGWLIPGGVFFLRGFPCLYLGSIARELLERPVSWCYVCNVRLIIMMDMNRYHDIEAGSGTQLDADPWRIASEMR